MPIPCFDFLVTAANALDAPHPQLVGAREPHTVFLSVAEMPSFASYCPTDCAT